jgi:CheY-like chemotaxis protein
VSTPQSSPIRSSDASLDQRSRYTGGALLALAITVAVAAPVWASSPKSGLATRGGAEATGSIGIRLVDAPASARDDPRAQVYIVDHLAPGTVITRRIEVSNTTGAAARLQLYAAAASIGNGSFLGAAGHTANDLSTWTSVVPGEPDVPAGGKLTATVTIAVPADAAPGEQYGVVWAETRSAPDAGGGITQVSRVGIRLYISVGPGGAPAAAFTIDTLTAQRSADGAPTVVAAVRNRGGRALDMNGSMELRNGPGGLSAGPFPASLGTTLAIGATEPVTIALDEAFPAGPWDARITLRSGLLEESVSAHIVFPAAGLSAMVKTTPGGAAWPKAALALLVGGVMAVALVVFRRRRRGGAAGGVAGALDTAGRPLEVEPAAAVIDLRSTVLICDDEPDIRLLFRTVVEATGAMVFVAADGEECLRVADDVEPDLVLLDLVLPGRGGREILGELRRRHPRIPVVVMSGTISGAELAQFRELGAADSIEKLGMTARIPGLMERYRRTA